MCYSEHMEVRGISPHLLFLRQGPLWRFCLLHIPASPHTSWHPPASAFYLCGTGGIKVTHCCVCLYTLEIRTQVLVLAQQALSLVTHLPTPHPSCPSSPGPQPVDAASCIQNPSVNLSGNTFTDAYRLCFYGDSKFYQIDREDEPAHRPCAVSLS